MHGSVLLVRPNGYLALHGIGFDPRALAEALAPWASRRSSVLDAVLVAAG